LLLTLANDAGLEPKRKSSCNGGEYSSPCPSCGGDDRFIMHPNATQKLCEGSFFCRQCGVNGDSITFCREFLNMEWREAVKRCGAENNVAFTLAIPRRSGPTLASFPNKVWLEAAEIFVEHAQKDLQHRETEVAWLRTRGLPFEAVQRYRIGFVGNENNYSIERKYFGLEDNDGRTTMWIPPGIVIPSMDFYNNVVRIKIRRSEWTPDSKLPKYIALSGSMGGMGVVGDRTKPYLVVVESELDAMALHHAIGDVACVVFVGGNNKNPDAIVDCMARNVENLLICHDNDDAGLLMLKKWKTLYYRAVSCPLPVGKDVGEAIGLGFDVREWFLNLMQ